jgi:hypothetical protein
MQTTAADQQQCDEQHFHEFLPVSSKN